MRLILSVFALGGTGLFGFVNLHYFYVFMAQMGLLFVPVIGVFVGAEIFLILWLQKHKNPAVARAGGYIGDALAYTALFQGVLFTTLVLWGLSVMFGFGGDAPQTRAEFLTDFMIGAGYLSAFIFGATGLTIVFAPHGGLVKLLGAFYAVATIAIPVYGLVFQADALRAAGASSAAPVALGIVVYLMIGSIAGMMLMMPTGPGPQKKAS
jgi:hypothetical protein